jgi:hypothetical protein
MKQIIATIENSAVTLNDDGSVTYWAKAAVDNDGSGGNPEGDPDHQDQTSLRHAGRSLNAQKVPFVVVPPAILQGVGPVVLGSQAEVVWNGVKIAAVVGDIGPHTRIGEISVECARRLGMNPSPLSGGIDSPSVFYTILPGIPAVVDGITYQLQPS